MPFGIPDATDLEKAAEGAEDHLYAVLTKFRQEFFADLERVLDERSLTFRKDGAPPKMGSPQ